MGSTSSLRGANPLFSIQKHGYNLLLPCRFFLRNPSTKHYGKNTSEKTAFLEWALEESPNKKRPNLCECVARFPMLQMETQHQTLAFPNQVLNLHKHKRFDRYDAVLYPCPMNHSLLATLFLHKGSLF